MSYLYTSLPLEIPHHSKSIALRNVVQGYRQLQERRISDESWRNTNANGELQANRKATLLYGHLHLPSSYLSALYLRRISASSLLKLSTVSSSHLKNGGTVLALLSHDTAKYSADYLFSTDGALLGVRGLWNFGLDPRITTDSVENFPDPEPTLTRNTTTAALAPLTTHVPPNGRFSAGCELYYGLINKSGGVSTGLRFTTLPSYSGFPYTMTATLNPLMGNLSSTYTVKAGRALTLCSRFDFNVYSYESELQVGLELWRRRRTKLDEPDELAWAKRKLTQMKWQKPANLVSSKGRLALFPEVCEAGEEDDSTAGVLKARVSQGSTISFLWEGRVKELLYSAGITMDFSKSARQGGIFRGIGIEFAYCS